MAQSPLIPSSFFENDATSVVFRSSVAVLMAAYETSNTISLPESNSTLETYGYSNTVAEDTSVQTLYLVTISVFALCSIVILLVYGLKRLRRCLRRRANSALQQPHRHLTAFDHVLLLLRKCLAPCVPGLATGGARANGTNNAEPLSEVLVDRQSNDTTPQCEPLGVSEEMVQQNIPQRRCVVVNQDEDTSVLHPVAPIPLLPPRTPGRSEAQLIAAGADSGCFVIGEPDSDSPDPDPDHEVASTNLERAFTVV